MAIHGGDSNGDGNITPLRRLDTLTGAVIVSYAEAIPFRETRKMNVMKKIKKIGGEVLLAIPGAGKPIAKELFAKPKIKKIFKRLGIGELHDIHLKLKDRHVSARVDLTGDKESVNVSFDYEIITNSSIQITLPPSRQISPDKSINFPSATAPFTILHNPWASVVLCLLALKTGLI